MGEHMEYMQFDGDYIMTKNKRNELIKQFEILKNDGLAVFDKSVFESICEKIIIGNAANPYGIMFIFKTKDEFYLDAKEYIMKNKAEFKKSTRNINFKIKLYEENKYYEIRI